MVSSTTSWEYSLARHSPAGLAWLASRGAWIPARHLRLLNRYLLDLAHGRIKRLMVMLPPRHGKSELSSHYFPAWFLGTFPYKRIMLASHGDRFAKSWGRKVRDVLKEWGGPLWGVKLRRDSGAIDEFDLADVPGFAGGMKTAGIGGDFTGRGCDGLIIDDATKNAEQAESATWQERLWEWWRGTARTRLHPGGWVLMIQTRWTRKDLPGRIQENRPDDWTVLRLPAIAEDHDPLGRQPGEALWPEQWPLAELRDTELELGPKWWDAEYQQNPHPEGGTEWPAEWFGPGIYFDEWPTDLSWKVMALDPSKGARDDAGDYSAWTVLGEKRGADELYAECDLERRHTGRIISDGVALLKRHWPVHGVLFEGNTFQDLLADEFQRACQAQGINLQDLNLYSFNNTDPKPFRIRRLTGHFSRKRLKIRNTPGGRLTVGQAKDFPSGTHDDGLDSLEMADRLVKLFKKQQANPHRRPHR